MEIAIACDSNYIVPTAVVLKSLFENNKGEKITINLLHLTSQTKKEDVQWLEQYILQHGHSFRPLPVSDELLANCPELRHSKSTYLRLLLPNLLSKEICKILYIDADIIVNRNLQELYSMKFHGEYVAAVKETAHILEKQHLQDIGISEGGFYFGAGVMLLNLNTLREDNCIDKFFLFATQHPEYIKWSDQDILNAVLWRKVIYLPPKYNFNFLIERDVAARIWTKKEIREVWQKPAIVHYIGPIKPWHYISFHPKTRLWWKYLRMTPFADYKPKDKNRRNFFKKYYLLIFRRAEMLLSLRQKKILGKLVPSALKKQFKKSVVKSI